jgi:hypothetical protein
MQASSALPTPPPLLLLLLLLLLLNLLFVAQKVELGGCHRAAAGCWQHW